MKKLLLALAGTAVVSGAYAQQSSVVFLQNGDKPTAKQLMFESPVLRQGRGDAGSMAKGTNGATGAWFSYVDNMFQSGIGTGYFWRLYGDSTVRSTATTFQGIYGLGVSFDPTSGAYRDPVVEVDGAALNTAGAPDFKVSIYNQYSVDSMYMLIKYTRRPFNGNVTDTLIIDLAATGVNNTFRRRYLNSPEIQSIDSSARFATATYNPVRNTLSDSIPAANRRRITVLLNNAFNTDTNTAGRRNLIVPITPALQVAAGEKVVAYASFHSGQTYPFGRLIDSVNHMELYSYEVDGADTYIKQHGVSDHTMFLWSTRQSKYVPPFTPFEIQGSRALIPSAAYADPTGFGLTYFDFFVKCPTCPQQGTVSTNNVAGSIREAVAVPNPASNNVTVRFNLKDAVEATVTLTNAVGQVVATQDLGKVSQGKAEFNVAGLSNGLYFYTINAGGQRLTQRVVVAH